MATGKLAALWNHEFQILEFPVPEPMEGSAVIKIEAAGICGSDGHTIKGTWAKPACEGHEFTGKIIALGPGANEAIKCYGGELKVGDRIAVYPHITCGHCDSCMTHGEGVCWVCENPFSYGGVRWMGPTVLNTDPYRFPHFKGGFGEYVHIFPRTFVWKVPDDMPPAIASLLDPTAVAMRAIELAMTEAGVLQEGVTTTTHALVVGAGPIGIITGIILREIGVEQLVFTGRQVQGKLDAAKEICGADEVINLKGLTPDERIEKVRDITGGGANLVINCANHPSSQIEGLQQVRKLGTYVEIGNAMSNRGFETPVDLAKVVFSRNARVTAVVANYPKTFDRAFRMLKRHHELPFARLITHTFSRLEDLLPTMKHMSDDDYLKGVYLPE